MRKNKIKQMMTEGKSVVNGWLQIPSTVSAEVMAHQGWDSLTIDMQHGLVDYQMALNMLQVISGSGKTPMVRVPWNEPGIIMKALDAGALGIICPMINTPEDAINFVGATRYAPVGHRSSGPTRALMVHGPSYHDEANEKIISFAMIETVEALENVEKIAATDGLTGIYIGPSDLSISMGFKPGLDRVEPEMIDAIKKIKNACKNNNIKVGIHGLSPSYLKDKLSNGYDLGTLASDVRIYAEGISNKMKETRS